MPWQHRLSRKELHPPPAAGAGAVAGAEAAGAPNGSSFAGSNQEGSTHGSLQAERSLRVPLDRLTRIRTDSSGRTIHSAR